jgi:protein gp37
MARSNIEWTDYTFNPWIGCTKVSNGCKHCYAETLMDERYKKVQWGPKGVRLRTSPTYWRQPFKWNREAEAKRERARVFCASLADVFEGPETMPEGSWPVVLEARNELWDLIHNTPWLDWQILTKRPENVNPWLKSLLGPQTPPPNMWIGTSVEDQKEADDRIPHLLKCPAVVRFLSCEPLLGPVKVNFGYWWREGCGRHGVTDEMIPSLGRRACQLDIDCLYCNQLPGTDQRIHWLISGGESGKNARPAHPDWFRSLRDQCQAAGVPYFFKQWGEWAPGDPQACVQESPHNGWVKLNPVQSYTEGGFSKSPRTLQAEGFAFMAKVGKKAAGRLLDGREWSEFPEVNRG